LGTVVAGKRSAAMMTVGKSAETLFYLGSPLQPGVFLKAVEANAVVLGNRGKAERVKMIEGKGIAGTGMAVTAPSMPAAMQPPM